jgi:hypothetical protein
MTWVIADRIQIEMTAYTYHGLGALTTRILVSEWSIACLSKNALSVGLP